MATPAEILSTGETVAAKVPCRRCSKPVDMQDAPDFVRTLAVTRGVLCGECDSIAKREATEVALKNSRALRVAEWERICPPDFRNTEPHRLPSPSKLQQVLKWQFGPKGLILHGSTGKGKTRCGYVLAKREFDSGRSIKVLDHGASLSFAEQYNDSPGAAKRWADSYIQADILFLDDVFKSRLTDSFESILFHIVGARTEAGRPIIATLNDTGQTLAGRLSQDRGDALVRRLREYADTIRFD